MRFNCVYFQRDAQSLPSRLIELSHTISIMHAIYVMTVTQHSRVDFTTPQTFRVSSYFNCIIITVVQVCYIHPSKSRADVYLTSNSLSQVYYAHRLTKCFSKPYCAYICLVLIFFQCLGFLIFLAEWNFENPKFAFISVAGFYAAGAADMLIALFLCYHLIKNRRNSFQTRSFTVLITRNCS